MVLYLEDLYWMELLFSSILDGIAVAQKLMSDWVRQDKGGWRMENY